MKKFFILTLLVAMVSLSSCLHESSDRQIAAQQEQLMLESSSQLGLPAIKNFQEKKLAKMIFELRDREDLVCYAYLVNKMSGSLVFVGKCMGYGLPYSIQYTNPEKIDYRNGTAFQLPQADPNGLFMPEGLSATWLMMIDPETNEPRPVYFEPEIVVSPFKLHK